MQDRGNYAATLHALARAAGIVDDYYDASSGAMRQTPSHTTVTLLRAMGLDASTEASAFSALESLRSPWGSTLCDSVRVVRGNEDLAVHLALPWEFESFTYEIDVQREDGEVATVGGRIDGTAGRSPRERRIYRIDTGFVLPHGYHEAHIRVKSASAVRETTQRIIVTPWRCVDPVELLAGKRAFGLQTNLYTVRGHDDLGIGNLGTLAELCKWAATHKRHRGHAGNGNGGASAPAFIGTNPLHSLRNRDDDVSPYAPSSRLFRNILYIDVRRVPELALSHAAREMLSQSRTQETIAELRASSTVQHERILELLLPIFRKLHDEFFEKTCAGAGDRARSYREYRERQGPVLDSYATFEAIAQYLRERGDAAVAADWARWPASLRDPMSDAVREFAAQHDREVDFHRYLQFEIDRQLSEAQRAAHDSGISIGLYGDMALASSGRGFDAWAFPGLFVKSVSVGAPPDAFSQEGQTWGCPPVSPIALRAQRYDYWIRLLRASFEHCGMLRVDHVMGMWRQFWVPEGMSARQGTYLLYPSDELLGILALESERAGALVVGEDLGNVPPEVRPALRDRAIMSSKVLYFERDESGSFSAPENYAELSLASVNTHDLPPLAGWWLGVDLMSRASSFDEKVREVELQRAFVQREWERRRLVAELVNRGLMDADTATRLRAIAYGDPIAPGDREYLAALVAATHEMMGRSAALLISLSLDDIALETEAVNRPGVEMQVHRSWTRKMARPLVSATGADNAAGAPTPV